jgi:hypothetical protein
VAELRLGGFVRCRWTLLALIRDPFAGAATASMKTAPVPVAPAQQ